jgi:hypothetical protein
MRLAKTTLAGAPLSAHMPQPKSRAVLSLVLTAGGSCGNGAPAMPPTRQLI